MEKIIKFFGFTVAQQATARKWRFRTLLYILRTPFKMCDFCYKYKYMYYLLMAALLIWAIL